VSGDRFLLDTNTVIELLRGNKRLETLISQATWIGISVLTVLEFRAFRKLSDFDNDLFIRFISRIYIIDIVYANNKLMDCITDIRKNHHLKLPDSIILATAVHTNSTLITADKTILKSRPSQVLGY
jgi:predicted nucleic acid-binding protein